MLSDVKLAAINILKWELTLIGESVTHYTAMAVTGQSEH